MYANSPYTVVPTDNGPLFVCRKKRNCEEKFINPFILYEHLKDHLREAVQALEKFKSDASSDFNHVQNGAKTHVQYSFCRICGLRFRCQKNLLKHIAKHNKPEKKDFHCTECKLSFTTDERYKKHFQKMHVNEMQFSCTFCDSKFPEKQRLKSHLRIHTGEKPYVCKLCDARFSSLSNRNKHTRVHTGEKPFACDQCELRFSDPTTLRNHRSFKHLKTEENVLCIKQYICDVCRRPFRFAGDLRAHTRIHSGFKPHGCRFCEKRFTQSTNLRKHERTHTGEKPYTCDQCGRNFSDKSVLNSHIKVIHAAHRVSQNY